MDIKKRNLPHIYRDYGLYFLTFRLHDSLPQAIILQLKEDYQAELSKLTKPISQEVKSEIKTKIFGKYEDQLDENKYGNCYLKNPRIAKIIYDKILSYNLKLYEIKNFIIMPNHVHLLLDTTIQIESGDKILLINKIMQLIKGGSSIKINKALSRSGRLWAEESFDSLIRSPDHYGNVFYYIKRNAIKAGLEENLYSSGPFYFSYDMIE